MMKFVSVLFGSDWKTSLIGFLGAVATAAVPYFSGGDQSEPGWYVVSLAFAALGRWAAQAKKPAA